MSRTALLLLLCLAAPAFAEPNAGVLPVGFDRRPLNLDFETGTLQDWVATGDAFAGQPIKGDTVHPRRNESQSNYAGQYWVGTFEVAGDKPQGTLTSATFVASKPWASFLVGGGSGAETRVDVVRADTKAVVFTASGRDNETMRRVAVDLRQVQNKPLFIRVVDESSGPWGHINFDDFKLHEQQPQLPKEKELLTSAAPPPPADVVKFAGLSPEAAVKAMTLPQGFKATLFAGEPDIVQPVAFCFDDRGRLWVAEAITYPQKAPPGKGKDRILIFEDTTGTGHFDKKTVFMEGLNLVSGLEYGFGGVWVGQAPELLFIPILEGDKPGKPEVLLDGFSYGDTHETLNSFAWGPDGWLYGCHGVFNYSKVGKPGTPDAQRVPINAAVWRFHPTKKIFEIFAEGASNQWGVDWDENGQAFITACVIPHLYHVIQGGRFQRQAGNHFEPYTYDDIKTIADHVHYAGSNGPHAGNNRSDSAGGGHAHCGAMVYLGDNWPAEYRNTLFMGNIHGNRINNDILDHSEKTGSGYVGHHGHDFLLMNDKWSRLIAEKYGPDGGVYVIDWYDQQACHSGNPQIWDRSNGRIYKITYGDVKPVQVDLQKLSDEELVKLQTNPNEWNVRHARRILQERASNEGDHFRALNAIDVEFSKTKDPKQRLRLLWASNAIQGLNERDPSRYFKDRDEYVRSWAIQFMTVPPFQDAFNVTLTNVANTDPSPVVRLYLASAACRLPLTWRWPVVEALAAHSEDVADHNLPLMYWYAIDPLVPTDVNRAAKLAIDTRIPLLRHFIARRLSSLPDNPAGLAAVVKSAASAADVAAQLDFLRAIAEGTAGRRSVPMPDGWQAAYDKLAASSTGEIRERAESLATLFGDARALGRLRSVLADSAASPASRLAALDALVNAKDAQLPPVLQSLLNDAMLRGSAIRALAGYDDPKTPAAILRVYGSLNVTEKRDALNTLASRTPYATQLLAALRDNTVPKADLTAPTVRNLSSLDDPAIKQWIATNWGTVRANDAEKAGEIKKLRAMLTAEVFAKADAAHGRALFAKTCQQCHTLFDVGAKIGPDLTGSNRADVNYLLENIIDPSAVIGKDYLLSHIVTKDGRIVEGIIKTQTDAALTVATTTEMLTLPRAEIARVKTSDVSMMPEGLLAGMSQNEVRDLIGYLRSSQQTPIAASPDNVALFFDGKTLANWDADPALWHVEDGQIVGKTPGLKSNNFAFSQMELSDFRLVFEVKLTPDGANSGVQFRSKAKGDGEAVGYQADIGAGWWGKIYEENGRGLLTNVGGEKFVHKNEWNTYEILAVGPHIRLAINGHVCSEIEDSGGTRKGICGLQLHAGGITEVRYRNFNLELNPKDQMKTAEAK